MAISKDKSEKTIETERQEPLPVPDLPERFLMDLHGDCNLSCPMCFRHGGVEKEEKSPFIGTMPVDAVRKVLDEIMVAQPLIQPSTWGEPLIIPELRTHITAMKERGISVAMTTNGLTLTEETAKFFVDIKLDAIFFSMDSMTPETLKKVRGVDKLEKIQRNFMMMLEIRGDAQLPRIGATFTVQEENEHELEEFIEYWTQHADVVRVGGVLSRGRALGMEVPKKRTPCGSLYMTMPIHSNGDALLCCLDSDAEHVMGNVFEDGVNEVWHGEGFTRMRKLHEDGDYDSIPFCKSCDVWAGYAYEEEIKGNLLIRRSPQFIYYNRIDRLKSWGENLRGHETPDPDSYPETAAKIDAA